MTQLTQTNFVSISTVIDSVSTKTYKCCMLVCLQYDVKHFPSVLASLIHQTLSNCQKSWEGGFDDLIEISPVLSRFKAENATNSQKALQACKNRGRIVCI